MTTIGLLVTLALGLLVAPLAAPAQPAGKVPRIGVLISGGRPPSSCSNPVFLRELRTLGYVEGQNILIEWRCAELNAERVRQFAGALVQLGVDVIVANGRLAALAAKAATTMLPIVFFAGGDPVPELVPSLARPGGNVTGVSNLMADLPSKRLEILKETVPHSERIAVLVNPDNPTAQSVLNTLTVTAQALRVHLHIVELRHAEALDTAFAAMTREGADALMMLSDPLLMDELLGRVADRATKSRLPAMYDWEMYVEAGGLMSFGTSLPERHRRAATYVDKLFKDAKPADLPVEQSTTFELVINLKTAEALGLTIPSALLFQADKVIR